MADKTITQKINRMKKHGAPRVLDLFSGCGGLSLGFDAAGFEVVGAVELDPIAVKSHALNFFKDFDDAILEIHARPRDITAVEPEKVIEPLRVGATTSAIDVIIAGPPCQAFARVGRAKLREVADNPEAFLTDSRANLYLRFLHYVRELKPVVILMENVPDVLNYGGHNIPEEICEVLGDMGYRCRYTLLNAAYYGVPQMRERMFLIACARELQVEPVFPSPTHWVLLPKGYEGARQVALKATTPNLFQEDFYYIVPPEASDKLPSAITASEALGDLPPITLHLEGLLKRGARRFDTLIPYPENLEASPYGCLMRKWPGFSNEEGIFDHVIRYLPRDYQIFRRMNPGDQYPEAHRHAFGLLREHIEQLATKGVVVSEGSPEYKELKKKIVPPYDSGKFPNKWRKMEADCPARTLMAHLGKDGYSHIHYDSKQARTISVREAARLQSFPDGFVFAGTMNPAFRQIGNAVPPLMGYALAGAIRKTLGLVEHTGPIVKFLREDFGNV